MSVRIRPRMLAVLRVAGIVLCIVSAVAILATRGRPARLDAVLPLSGVVIAFLFAISRICTVESVIRGHRYWISLAVVPLVFGLFLTPPLELVVGAVVGVAVADLIRHRRMFRAPKKSTWLLELASSWSWISLYLCVAVVIFDLAVTQHSPRWYLVLIAMIAAAVASAIRQFGRWWRNLLLPVDNKEIHHGEMVLAVLTWTALAALTAAAMVSFDAGVAAYPLAASGSAALVGYRAYQILSRRQNAVEHLYQLTGNLGEGQDPTRIVTAVLEQALALVQAPYAEVLLEGIHGVGFNKYVAWRQWSGRRCEGPFDGEDLARAITFPPTDADHVYGFPESNAAALAIRELRCALQVPVTSADGVIGHVLVGEVVDQGRRFGDMEVRLLETVGNHAGIALSNARLIERLNVEARRDDLTGLANRAAFRDQLDEVTADLHVSPCALMLMDLDGFKAINDSLGHSAGDELLCEFSRRLSDITRQEGMVARLGGDEFAVLAPGCADVSAAMTMAHRVLTIFDKPVLAGGARIRLGGSLGVALGPMHGHTGADLMRCADMAMYAAKADTGGARLFTPDLLDENAQSLTLGADLEEAVEHDDIDLVAHPVISLATGRVHSVEVLARWHHPELGEISPRVFFKAAEQSGLVPALSRRILLRALRYCRQWLDADQQVRVAINVAPRWLADTGLPQTIGAALAEYGIPADMLCLELTEHSVIADPMRVTATLEGLRAMGVHLSVDDFGTGYSSLTFLSRLPVDQLKIDEMFVSRLGEPGRDLAIVRSILDLGHHLGLEVVAEGIKSEQIRDQLAELGCELGQGYLYAHPFHPRELADFIARTHAVPVQRSPLTQPAAST